MFIMTIFVIIFIIISALRFVAKMILSIIIRRLSKKIDKKYAKNESMNGRTENMGEKTPKDVYFNVTKIPKDKEPSMEEPNYNKKEVVGIVKPVGKFSAMIMGEKISYLVQNIEKLKTDIRKDGNITVNKIKIHSHDTKGRGVKRS